MSKGKRSKAARRPSLKPSYTTRLHFKRRLKQTDWRFLAALGGLIGSAALAATYLSIGAS